MPSYQALVLPSASIFIDQFIETFKRGNESLFFDHFIPERDLLDPYSKNDLCDVITCVRCAIYNISFDKITPLIIGCLQRQWDFNFGKYLNRCNTFQEGGMYCSFILALYQHQILKSFIPQTDVVFHTLYWPRSVIWAYVQNEWSEEFQDYIRSNDYNLYMFLSSQKEYTIFPDPGDEIVDDLFKRFKTFHL